MLSSIIDYTLIGSRIKKRRIALNKTQEEMANDLSFSNFYISKIENGKSNPTLETLALIANYLELDLAYLIAGTSTLEDKYYKDQLNELASKASNKQLDLIIRLIKAVLDE